MLQEVTCRLILSKSNSSIELSMEHFDIYGNASQTTYFPGRKNEQQAPLYISRVGDTRGNGNFHSTFLTPYSWGLLCMQGQASVQHRDKNLHLSKGDFLLARANEEINFSEIEQVHYLWFDIRGTAAEATINSHFSTAEELFHLKQCDRSLLQEIEYLKLCFSKESYNSFTQSASAWKLLESLCRQPQQQKKFDIAHACRTLIESEFARGIRIKTISAKLEVSRSTLFRKFKAAYGNSPKQYLDQLKLEQACLLLKTTRLNIEEIAYQSGFDTPQNFYIMFRKHLGKCPSELRA